MEGFRNTAKWIIPVLAFFFFTCLCACHKDKDCDRNSGVAAEETLTAQITPSQNSVVMQGQTLTFQGSASGGTGPYLYFWSLDGDSIYSSDNPVSVPYGEPGTYSITLIVQDSLDATSSITGTVKVIPSQQNEGSFISAGLNHTLAIDISGALWAWGYNLFGELGDGTWVDKTRPVNPLTDSEFTSISAGDYCTVAINTDGTLWAWGDIYDPAVYTWLKRNTPVRINPDSDWRSISACSSDTSYGANFLLATKTNNTLWKWDFQYNKMVQMSEAADWLMVSNGPGHASAVKMDGTLWTWGKNEFGQLGVYSVVNTENPVQVENEKPWLTASSGGRHMIALLSDGTVWAWGDNSFGQLGNGTFDSTREPVQVGSDTDWIAVSAGLNHSMALKSNGTLWAWGDNYYGQLGDGTYAVSSQPVQVTSDLQWVTMNTRANHVIALKRDGSYWTWGANGVGQLGNGQNNRPGIGAPVMIKF